MRIFVGRRAIALTWGTRQQGLPLVTGHPQVIENQRRPIPVAAGTGLVGHPVFVGGFDGHQFTVSVLHKLLRTLDPHPANLSQTRSRLPVTGYLAGFADPWRSLPGKESS
jgi:hypothetical protein